MSDNNPTADDIVIEDESGSHIEKNLKSRPTWLRALFMLIYCGLIWLAGMVGIFVVVLGFFWVLFTGEVNKQLRQVGQGIASYMYQIVRYLTYNTDTKPFPFGESWPTEPTEESE